MSDTPYLENGQHWFDLEANRLVRLMTMSRLDAVLPIGRPRGIEHIPHTPHQHVSRDEEHRHRRS
jgi:hypothetical protein